MSEHLHYMGRALEQARAAGARGDRPVASIIVRGGEILGEGQNTMYSDFDPSAHAEIAAGRWLQQDQLIAADASMAIGKRGGKGGIDGRQSARAGVEHDEVVAQPVHLGEFDPHGARSMRWRASGPEGFSLEEPFRHASRA